MPNNLTPKQKKTLSRFDTVVKYFMGIILLAVIALLGLSGWFLHPFVGCLTTAATLFGFLKLLLDAWTETMEGIKRDGIE